MMVGQRGFTLIEMAMVIAVIGLMVGGGLFALAPVVEKARENTTATTMDQIDAALVLFAIQNGRLPCPADGHQTNASATYGLEVAQSGGNGYNANACNITPTNSVIPWRTLGIDETYSLDGWGNRISFFPASAMYAGVNTLVWVDTTAGSTDECLQRNTTTKQNRSTGTNCDPVDVYSVDNNTYPFGNYIAVYAISGNACGQELTQPNTNNTGSAYSGTDTCTAVSSPTTVTTGNATSVVQYDGLRAAYVLISHGQSGWYAWNKGGTQIQPPNTGYTLKKYNSGVAGNLAGTANNLGFAQGNNQFINNRGNANYFDDIVRWRSPAFIIQNCGAGSCGNP